MARKEIPFSGKLITDDPVVIGENFQSLKNMRYTDTHIEGVGGMSKINSTALTTYLKTRSAFHFKKFQPAESHVLVQAENTGLTASQILENTTAIPGAGDFSATALWTDSTGYSTGRFSEAPDGQVIYCNGVDSCIWGGSEMKLGAFLTSDAAVTGTDPPTNPKDYTTAVNNTKKGSDDIAIIGGGLDSYTKLLMHCDGVDTSTTFTDETTTHTPGVGGGSSVQIDTAQAVFGTGSIQFVSASSDYITIADHADFFLSTGAFTIDFWIKFNVLPTAGNNSAMFQNWVDADNFAGLWLNNTGGTYTLKFQLWSATTHEVDIGEVWATPIIDKWYHIALQRGWANNANDWAITLDGTILGSSVTDSFAWPDYAGTFEIGKYGAGTYFDGWIDEFRLSKGICRWPSGFTVPTHPYKTAARTWIIGTTRPLQSVKYYLNNPNELSPSTTTLMTWTGHAWGNVPITDNTDTGASLSQDGTMTFTSTIAKSKPKYMEGYFLYWYQFTLDDGESELYHVTVDAAFQDIIDLWDGIFRNVVRFYIYTTAYLDNTINVLYDDYDSTAAYTYSDLSSLAAFSDPNNALEIGFDEKMTGLKIDMAPEQVNSTAATVMSIDYWNGEEFLSVGNLTDGTSEGSISLAKSGVVTWNNNSIGNETKKVVSNSPALFFYRVKFDKAMDADVQINYVSGITAQEEMKYYKFPVFAQGRVLLCADMSESKNKAVVSGKYTPHVYNGVDSVDVYFGDEGELTAGTELFSQYGSSLYSLILMFKDNETWIMAGQDINEWENNIFLLSNTIGCPAPLTLKTINLHAEPGVGINRSLAIWQGTNGIYMSDGRAPIPIHGDIKEYFDPKDSRAIKASKVGDSIGFIDANLQEYHWIFASGTGATTLNTELVYDIARNKWFEIERSSDLQCGIIVHDTDGNDYNYGFLDTGYMERLENGSDSDGTAITQTVHTGDMAFAGLAVETQLDAVRLITVAKTTNSNDITLTHYGSTATSGTDHAMSPVRSGYRVAQPIFDDHLPGDPFHSFKFVHVTTNIGTEKIGFEPLAFVATYHPTHED